jgi:division/cell wall cluster transcriptional repressor MraZ
VLSPVSTTAGERTTTGSTMSRFLGTHSRNIDDKQRLPLPRDFRDVLGDSSGIVTRLGDALALYTEERFDELLDRLEIEVRAGDQELDLLRGITGNAYPVRPDAQNRIKLPKQIMQDDELEGELVLLGAGHRVEIRPIARHRPVETAAGDALSATSTRDYY